VNLDLRNTRWLREVAGPSFTRADTVRDERAAEDSKPFERLLRDLAGGLPSRQVPGRAIAKLSAAVDQEAATLRALPNEVVAMRFKSAVQGLAGALERGAPALRLARVFACIGEASRRQLGLWPHPVQWAGARVLLRGSLAEMPTGEGKTLVAAIAATAMAGAGASVHVISTNDYLARRDSEEMGPLLEFFGLGCSHVEGGMDPDARRAAYSQSVCYVSGKELVFDYLKDRLSGHGELPSKVAHLQAALAGADQLPPRPLIPALHFAIVDEADSVLIDEARTPMILSRDAASLFEPAVLKWAIESARRLKPSLHFRLQMETRSIDLLPAAWAALGAMPDHVRRVWRAPAWRQMLLSQALSAIHLYRRDQHYIVAEDKVQIVDESTGRVMPDRSWEQGLHQLIETKEGVPITSGRETVAKMTFQRFFRRYYLLSGLTGTAREASRELWTVYRLRVRRVPPNRPNQRRRLSDGCLPTAARKWQAVVDDAYVAAKRGQPVLVGTRSVWASEQVSAEFRRRGIDHVVLNARQDVDEAHTVAQAGQAGRITVATNMAGRGTDIKPDDIAKSSGGLHVILTEFHDSPRVDRQLFGRSGRQGDPGTARAIVAADDGLFEAQPIWLRRVLSSAGGPLQRWALRLAVRAAQSRAERMAFRTRMQTLRQDREMHKIIGFAGRVT
jgi:preprotein translocase subunit SecA